MLKQLTVVHFGSMFNTELSSVTFYNTLKKFSLAIFDTLPTKTKYMFKTKTSRHLPDAFTVTFEHNYDIHLVFLFTSKVIHISLKF